jgi:CO/xanthine dehydrogenase FAD-binding subunit
MKPAPFKYIAAFDENALITALADCGEDARLLAGGQSLVPMMNFRVAAPAVIIDLNGVETLNYISCGEDTLRIGSLTRHAMLEDSEELSQRCPLLCEAARHVAHRAVRNRGTIGGTLALAYPGAEIPLALMTLGATVRLRSHRGERRVDMQDFMLGALDTVLSADEYIHDVEVRLPPQNSTASLVETSRRNGDFAIGVAAVVAGRDARGRLTNVRAGVSGGTGTPIRLARLEEAVIAGEGRDSVVADACREAIDELEVFGDHHYPEDYRRHVLKSVLRRALGNALVSSGVHHGH